MISNKACSMSQCYLLLQQLLIPMMLSIDIMDKEGIFCPSHCVNQVINSGHLIMTQWTLKQSFMTFNWHWHECGNGWQPWSCGRHTKNMLLPQVRYAGISITGGAMEVSKVALKSHHCHHYNNGKTMQVIVPVYCIGSMAASITTTS